MINSPSEIATEYTLHAYNMTNKFEQLCYDFYTWRNASREIRSTSGTCRSIIMRSRGDDYHTIVVGLDPDTEFEIKASSTDEEFHEHLKKSFAEDIALMKKMKKDFVDAVEAKKIIDKLVNAPEADR